MALLGLNFGELQQEVNEYLFGGSGAPVGETNIDIVKRVIHSGCRQFYSPPPLGNYAHEWSFLKPVTKRTIQAPYTNGATNTAYYQHVGATSGDRLMKIDRLSVIGRSSGAKTYTTASPHGFVVGDVVRIHNLVSGGDLAHYTFTIVSLPTLDSFEHSEASVPIDVEDAAVSKDIPSWATSGLFDFNGVSYPIAEVLAEGNAYKCILDEDDNPGTGGHQTTATFKIHQDDYNLEADFGRIVGNITFSEKDNAWHTVRIVGEGRIRELRQRDYAASSSTDPMLAAIVPKRTRATSATGGSTTHQIKFWPAITSAATIHYRYEVRPQALEEDTDYPYGADDHSDTILYSCLSEAERRLDREAGVYKMRFMEALAASVEKDGRANRPELLGYNSDQSDGFDPEHTRIFGGRIRHKQQDGTFLE